MNLHNHKCPHPNLESCKVKGKPKLYPDDGESSTVEEESDDEEYAEEEEKEDKSG